LIDGALQYLEDLPEDYKDKIPRWHKQPAYTEIWIEKNAVAQVFKSILDPQNGSHKEMRQVRIIPNGGWSSRTYWVNNANRINSKIADEVGVLYFGDYDPSGSRMVKNLKEMLSEKGIEFKAVAVTKQQIRKFNLQHLKNTDPTVLAKLKKDNNRFEFMKENDGQLFQIELDALQALRPDDLRKLLLDSVDSLFDEDIYDKVMNEPEHQPEEIKTSPQKTRRACAGTEEERDSYIV
jgi:hypothetical protein